MAAGLLRELSRQCADLSGADRHRLRGAGLMRASTDYQPARPSHRASQTGPIERLPNRAQPDAEPFRKLPNFQLTARRSSASSSGRAFWSTCRRAVSQRPCLVIASRCRLLSRRPAPPAPPASCGIAVISNLPVPPQKPSFHLRWQDRHQRYGRGAGGRRRASVVPALCVEGPRKVVPHPRTRKAAGFQALLVTVDSIVAPNREFHARRGFTIPMTFNPRNVVSA